MTDTPESSGQAGSLDAGPAARGEDDVFRLRRWEDAGGTWRVVARHPDWAAVALLRCDAGEEVERLTSRDAELIAYLAGRSSSEEPDTGPSRGGDPGPGPAPG